MKPSATDIGERNADNSSELAPSRILPVLDAYTDNADAAAAGDEIDEQWRGLGCIAAGLQVI